MVLEVGDGERAFGAFEGVSEGVFTWAGGSGVAFAEAGESSSAERCVVGEGIAGEGVPDADVVIEVRQGWNEERVGRLAFDDDGEPQAQFAEPHGGRIDVDAEDGSSEELAAQFPDRPGVAELGAEGGEQLEDVDEECAAAACRVEDGDGGASIAEVAGVGVRDFFAAECAEDDIGVAVA